MAAFPQPAAITMATPAFHTVLDHEALLAVRGVDAGRFLQGQLTCNIQYLSPQRAGLGARCTVKGRMLSSFRILAEGDGYLLALDSQLLEKQLADLKKYAVFSKATLTDESSAWQRFGLQQAEVLLDSLGLQPAPEPNSLISRDGLLAVRCSADRVELWVPTEQAAAIEQQLADALPRGTLNDWLLGQVRAGIGQVFAATSELFIPQMINLQAVDGVSFKKGCYTGQEIVARMQYRGKLKRRLYRLALAGPQLPAPGTVLHNGEHPGSAGEVVLAASCEQGCELLAVIQEDALLADQLHLENRPLSLLDLPYELDADREIQR